MASCHTWTCCKKMKNAIPFLVLLHIWCCYKTYTIKGLLLCPWCVVTNLHQNYCYYCYYWSGHHATTNHFCSCEKREKTWTNCVFIRARQQQQLVVLVYAQKGRKQSSVCAVLHSFILLALRIYYVLYFFCSSSSAIDSSRCPKSCNLQFQTTTVILLLLLFALRLGNTEIQQLSFNCIYLASVKLCSLPAE